MLSRVLLHVIDAPRPIDPPAHGPGSNRRRRIVDDLVFLCSPSANLKLLLSEAGAPQALTDIITRLLNNELSLTAIGEKAHQKVVDLFNVDKMVDLLLGAYTQLLRDLRDRFFGSPVSHHRTSRDHPQRQRLREVGNDLFRNPVGEIVLSGVGRQIL